jgi:hypothetical protein
VAPITPQPAPAEPARSDPGVFFEPHERLAPRQLGILVLAVISIGIIIFTLLVVAGFFRGGASRAKAKAAPAITAVLVRAT